MIAHHEVQHLKRSAMIDLLDYILSEIHMHKLDREGIIKLLLRLRSE